MSVSEQIQDQEQIPVAAARKRIRQRKLGLFLLMCTLCVALLVLLWSQLLTPASNAPGGLTGKDPNLLGDIQTPLIGKQAPNFQLENLQQAGSKISLADFKGKPVILNFWGSWCIPCQNEAPFLAEVAPKLEAKGIVFIGIDVFEEKQKALDFLSKYKLNYLNVQDTINSSTGLDYGVSGYPETIFIDAQGKVVAKWALELNQHALRFELARMGITWE